MTSEYLLSLGYPPETPKSDTVKKKEALAIESVSQLGRDAALFYNSHEGDEEIKGAAVQDLKGASLSADLDAIVKSDLPPEEGATLARQRRDASLSDIIPELEVAAGLEVAGSGPDMTTAEVKAEKQTNFKGLFDEISDRVAAETIDASSKMKTAGEFLEDSFIGTPTHEVANSLNAVFDISSTRLNMKEMFNEAREQLSGLSPEEQRKRMEEFVAELRDRAGTVSDNDYGFYQAVMIASANWDGTDNVEDAFNQLGVTLEAIPVIGTAFKGVRLLAGTKAARLAKNKEGAEALAKAAKTPEGEDMVKALGADPADVAGSLHVPQRSVDEFNPNYHYIDPDLVDPAKAEARRLDFAQDMKEKLGGSPRLNNAVMEDTAGGFNMTVELGSTKGNPFRTRKAAENLAEEIEGAEIAELDNGFVVRYKEGYRWQSDDLPGFEENIKDSSRIGSFVDRFFGRNAIFNKGLNNIAHAFEREGVLASERLKETISPYMALGKRSQDKVGRALTAADAESKSFNKGALIERFGLNAKEREGYESVRRMADHVWGIKNARARGQMLDRGWRSKEIGGTRKLLAPVEGKPKAKIVLDESGKEMPMPASPDSYRFWRVMGEDDGTGDIVDLIAVPKGGEVDELPFMVLNKAEGALPRAYRSPAYVRKEVKYMANGVEKTAVHTVASARNSKEAKKYAESLKAEDGIKYFHTPADEVLGVSGTREGLDNFVEEGLILGRKRRPNPVTDIGGRVNLPDAGERIGQLRNEGAVNAGIGRYLDVAQQRLTKEFGDLGFTGVLQAPARRPSDPTAGARYDKALTLFHHIRNLRGISIGQTSPTISGLREGLSDFVFRTNIPGSGVLGREISGQETRITDTIKAAAYKIFLSLNPPKQIVLQATMAPTYAGVKGGFAYMSGGRAAADMLSLAMGKRMPRASKDFDKLQKAFKDSGISALVDDHILTVGRSPTSGIAKANGLVQPIESVTRAAQEVGMNKGVLIDKSASFLFASERFRTINGRLPKNSREWKEVYATAEGLAMNQNRSDTLYTQNGALSVIAQFMSHQIKLTGRLLGREGDFLEKNEGRRMALAQVASYGGAAFGLNEVYEAIVASSGVDVPQWVDTIIRQGLTGSAVNMVLNLGNSGDPVNYAFSDRFAPANFMASYAESAEAAVGAMLSSERTLEFNVGDRAAGLNLFGSMWDAIKFSATIFGHTAAGELSAEDAVKTVVPEYTSMFPISGNMSRAAAAFQLGEMQNSRGQRIATLPQFQGAIAGIMGIPTQAAVDYQETLGKLYGDDFEKFGDHAALLEEVDNDSKKAAEKVIKIIERAHNGDIRHNEFLNIMETLNEGSRLLRQPTAHGRFMNGIWRAVSRHKSSEGITAQNMISGIVRRAVAQGRLEPDRDLVNWVRQQEFEGAGTIANELDRQIFKHDPKDYPKD